MLGKPKRQLVAAVFPPPHVTAGNPYVPRLHAALERRGVSFYAGNGLSPTWVERARGHVDVVHLHWLEYIVRYPGTGLEGLARTHLQVARYALALRRLRAAGIRIVWTVHNRRPHERRYPWLDAPLFRYTAAHVDGTILHSQTAAARFAADVRRPICAWIAPHPHYRDAYPRDGRPRSEQRADYGLDESSFVYLMFGQARAYKRIPQAIRAFRELSDEDARLIVAGAPVDDGIAEDIVQAAGGDKRVLLLLRFIPDSEVSTLFELSDAAVLNHREVFSSGILLLALSYGVPVVAPQEGSARDVAGPPAVETFPAGGLSGALSAVRQVQAETRRRVALEAVEPFTYDALADEVLKAYIGEGGTKVTSDHAAASV